MDKSWMNLDTLNIRYLQEIIDFIEFARKNQPQELTEIKCPCTQCKNLILVKIDLVVEHLIVYGFDPKYKCWIFHGEEVVRAKHVLIEQGEMSRNDGMEDMLHDAFGMFPPRPINEMRDTNLLNDTSCGPDKETEYFFNLLKEAETELYPGCVKFSLLSFVVQLMHIKCLSSWSNKSFTSLLELLKEAFPEGETLPDSFSACKKLVRDLGLDYHKVYACPNVCMLYWRENTERVDCKVCKTSRYKQFEKEAYDNKGKPGIPQKIVRYFPLIPRLKRLFMSSKTSSLMRWHAENPSTNGIMRHPVDSDLWKHYDQLYPDFAQEARNVRLGLASDGFNPFRTMNISYSTWPVVITIYNLPPWLCMKQPYLMLSLLIDGPKAPGNDIDVYLSLIVDELKELSDKGAETFDATNNEMFRLRAILLWTINDFPAYA